MLIKLLFRIGETTVLLKQLHYLYKTLGRAKAIQNVTLLGLSDEDRVRILVFSLELAKSPKADKANTQKANERDIKSELVYWTGLLDDGDILGTPEVTALRDGGNAVLWEKLVGLARKICQTEQNSRG